MTKDIHLTQNKIALVDDDDFEMLSKFKWFFNSGYARCSEGKGINRKKVLMHRMIMLPPKNIDIDHINGNKLDNRRSNLRLCIDYQNIANSKVRSDNASGLKGAHWHKKKKIWTSSIRINKILKHLGYFHTAKDAARAYDKAAKIHFGPFAKLNFPEDSNG